MPSAATSGESDVAALKPRGGDGPIEVELDQAGCTMLIPVEGGGRLVVVLDSAEAEQLGTILAAVRA